ncbi:hypothetical protein DFP94_10849 [Fontibacillus phaseoli]|uniref:Uncharacterized protein n=1 Tax=Fontibacillus phaseoli TaxID=1416533 RepID=A0A369B835_9BACL|nr:hypothetical protein [Fontibacillus phaseoli]RCX17690.1 hypothetical protein DFP94_10849 [Fontibacillus phaseoli]
MNGNNDEYKGNSNEIELRLNHLEKRMEFYDKRWRIMKKILISVFFIWLLLFLVGVIQFVSSGF